MRTEIWGCRPTGQHRFMVDMIEVFKVLWKDIYSIWESLVRPKCCKCSEDAERWD